jgi:hypothetical protein
LRYFSGIQVGTDLQNKTEFKMEFKNRKQKIEKRKRKGNQLTCQAEPTQLHPNTIPAASPARVPVREKNTRNSSLSSSVRSTTQHC